MTIPPGWTFAEAWREHRPLIGLGSGNGIGKQNVALRRVAQPLDAVAFRIEADVIFRIDQRAGGPLLNDRDDEVAEHLQALCWDRAVRAHRVLGAAAEIAAHKVHHVRDLRRHRVLLVFTQAHGSERLQLNAGAASVDDVGFCRGDPHFEEGMARMASGRVL